MTRASLRRRSPLVLLAAALLLALASPAWAEPETPPTDADFDGLGSAKNICALIVEAGYQPSDYILVHSESAGSEWRYRPDWTGAEGARMSSVWRSVGACAGRQTESAVAQPPTQATSPTQQPVSQPPVNQEPAGSQGTTPTTEREPVSQLPVNEGQPEQETTPDSETETTPDSDQQVTVRDSDQYEQQSDETPISLAGTSTVVAQQQPTRLSAARVVIHQDGATVKSPCGGTGHSWTDDEYTTYATAMQVLAQSRGWTVSLESYNTAEANDGRCD